MTDMSKTDPFMKRNPHIGYRLVLRDYETRKDAHLTLYGLPTLPYGVYRLLGSTLTEWEGRREELPEWVLTAINFLRMAGPHVILDLDGPCVWHGAGYYWFYEANHKGI